MSRGRKRGEGGVPPVPAAALVPAVVVEPEALAVVADAVRLIDGRKVVTEAGRGVAQRMRARGHGREAIAAALGISRRTLNALEQDDAAFADAMARGHAALENFLLSKLLSRVDESDLCLIYAMNNLLGMKSSTPRDGVGQQVNIAIQVPQALSREQYLALLKQPQASGGDE